MDYILLNNILDNKTIESLLNNNNNEYEKSNNVNDNIRKDIVFSQSKRNLLDIKLFCKIKTIVEENFNINLKYREFYKLKTYYGKDNEFIVPYTDTCGNEQRKISMVMCLTKKRKLRRRML